MIDLPAIVAILVTGWGLVLLGLAVAGAWWLAAEWRHAARGAEAMRRWRERRRWNGGGR